jgi:hypothetical protein
MKGHWIIKEVYFEDGFPKIIRDIERETPGDRELMDKAWDYLAAYTVGERPNASEVNDLIFALESRLTQPKTPEVTSRLTPDVADHHPSITYKMLPSKYTVYKKGNRNE